MQKSIHRAAIVAIGTFLVLGTAARANEIATSTRENITQTVRDDVRRHIQERNVQPQHEHHYTRQDSYR